MFRGANSINLDAKGRIAIPARYRDRLSDICNGRMVVTKNPYELDTPNLLLFPLHNWEDFEEQVRALPSSKKAYRLFKRVTIGSAKEVDVDGNGRLLLPAELRDFAGLSKSLMLVGQGETFQIWDETQWKAQEADDLSVLADEEFDSEQLPDLAF
ncbi:division/cell wall cluster transcriptional repressor MraZ [Pleionea mediterranea]|uniref:Transcriptional regulator MraZ n=1 Tax=Pleionea mediterranea TaxID=523701 RepID=A0A316FGL1_9GAMM|nr:division/cell wall cluster transcriptional repressor MraZ [Pleionea mediterranea]PWK47944.1 division/cell wall cluster transcriptional repressor MraZ [Pleionea mediterranea]